LERGGSKLYNLRHYFCVAAAVVCKSDLEKLSRVQNVRLLAVVRTMDGLLIRLKIIFGQNIKNYHHKNFQLNVNKD
jgi:hypothetical protein